LGPFLILTLSFALAGGFVGKAKGSSFWIWFLICSVPPYIGLAAAVLYRVERDEPRRACPTCDKVVPLYQAICNRCGTELDYTDEQIPSETALAGR
jgi:uncharacterized paraquat-inducible protein A